MKNERIMYRVGYTHTIMVDFMTNIVKAKKKVCCSVKQPKMFVYEIKIYSKKSLPAIKAENANPNN